MNNFEINSTCAKCGHTEQSIIYKEAYSGTQYEGVREHLLKTCKQCKYTWKEETADYDE